MCRFALMRSILLGFGWNAAVRRFNEAFLESSLLTRNKISRDGEPSGARSENGRRPFEQQLHLHGHLQKDHSLGWMERGMLVANKLDYFQFNCATINQVDW